VVSFEHWKWGWLPAVGGAFRLWLEAGATAEAWELLDDDQWRQVEDLQRRVLQKVIRESRPLGPRPDLEVYYKVTSFVNYWDEDDLMAWLTLLKPWVPDLAAKLGRHASIAAEFTRPHTSR
jgi:hypothetical protein